MKKTMRIISLCMSLALSIGLLAGCGGGSKSPAAPAASGGAAAPAPASGGEYKFTVNNFYAAVNNHGLLGKAWCDEITARTEGRVQFEYYPGASLVSDADSYNSIKNGIVDIAMFSTASNPGVFPAMSMLELPQGYANGWVGTMVSNEFIDKFAPAEFNGIKLLYTHTVSPLVILGNKEIASAADFDGMIIRSGSELATNTVNALKGQAYSCQITELFEALTKGMCDAAISGIDTLNGFNLKEAVKYVYRDPSYGKIAVIATCMNEAKWNALPNDVKQIFEEVSDEFATMQGQCWMYEDSVALDEFTSSCGGKVVEFDEATKAALQEALAPVNSSFVEKLSLSAEDVAAYQAFLDERIAYYNGQIPDNASIQAWNDEYLSKLS